MNEQVALMNAARAERGITGGRPLLYESAELLQKDINKYFDTTPQDEWTITGLAVALKTSRQTLMNMESKPEFFDTVKAAKDMVEWAYELSLRRNGRSGDIFGLKNFGWRDTQDIRSESEITVKPAQDVTQEFAQFVKAKTEAIDGEVITESKTGDN